jgi:hypothetical protein
MSENLRNIYVDIYTNTLDTVCTAKRLKANADGDKDIEANIMKYILAGKRPVLTLPQVCDNDIIIKMATRPGGSGFLGLAQLDLMGISYFDNFNTVSEFVISRLKNPEYTFTNKYVSKLMDYNTEIRTNVKNAMAKAILKESMSGFRLTSDVLTIEDNLAEYCEGIIKLNNTFKGHYSPNFPKKFTFSQELGRLINLLDNENTNKKIFLKLYDPAKNGQSSYLTADGSWQKQNTEIYGENAVNSFLDLVNFAYNCLMCFVIAKNHEWVTNANSSEIEELIRKEAIINNNNDPFYLQQYKYILENNDMCNIEILDWDKIFTYIRGDILTKINMGEITDRRDIFEDVRANRLMDFDFYTENTAIFKTLRAKTSSDKVVTVNTVEKVAECTDFIASGES